MAGLQPDLDRPGHPDRVDAQMTAKTAILDRDHRGAHRCRDFIVAQPAPEAGAERHQQGAVRGADPDHLAQIGPSGQLLIVGKGGHRDRDGNPQADQRHETGRKAPFQGGDEDSLGTGRRGAGHWVQSLLASSPPDKRGLSRLNAPRPSLPPLRRNPARRC